MTNIFTLQTIPITNELGMALKNFRIEHEVTATSIVNEFSKASTYITKLEKGEIKKIDANFLIAMCNYITKSDSGLKIFLSKIGRNYSEYSDETKLILKNIDELLIEHNISSAFIDELNLYINEHNINIQQLADKINANEDLNDIEFSISNAPINEWFYSDATNDRISIKLDVPVTYLKDILEKKICTIYYVIAEAILYALYRLGNENDAHTFANSKLRINNIIRCIGPNIIEVNDDNMDSLFGGLQPETSEALHDIASYLKLVVNLTKKDGYGLKHIQQINSNLETDLGFSFAYMSINLESLSSKSKETKQEFLKELRVLIDKYSQDETGLDIYE